MCGRPLLLKLTALIFATVQLCRGSKSLFNAPQPSSRTLALSASEGIAKRALDSEVVMFTQPNQVAYYWRGTKSKFIFPETFLHFDPERPYYPPTSMASLMVDRTQFVHDPQIAMEVLMTDERDSALEFLKDTIGPKLVENIETRVDWAWAKNSFGEEKGRYMTVGSIEFDGLRLRDIKKLGGHYMSRSVEHRRLQDGRVVRFDNYPNTISKPRPAADAFMVGRGDEFIRGATRGAASTEENIPQLKAPSYISIRAMEVVVYRDIGLRSHTKFAFSEIRGDEDTMEVQLRIEAEYAQTELNNYFQQHPREPRPSRVVDVEVHAIYKRNTKLMIGALDWPAPSLTDGAVRHLLNWYKNRQEIEINVGPSHDDDTSSAVMLHQYSATTGRIRHVRNAIDAGDGKLDQFRDHHRDPAAALLEMAQGGS